MRASAPGQSALLMLDVAASLRSDGIPYVVIGAMAAAVHGSVRASLDADALVSVTISVAKSLQGRFSTEGLTTEPRVTYDLKVADVNGDGRPDVIIMYEADEGSSTGPRAGSIHRMICWNMLRTLTCFGVSVSFAACTPSTFSAAWWSSPSS